MVGVDIGNSHNLLQFMQQKLQYCDPLKYYYTFNPKKLKKNHKNMDSSSDDPHTLCTKCNNFIRTPNFLIHEARCKGPSSNLQQSRVTSRIFNNSRLQHQRPRQESYREPIREEEERIPCPFCSYPQTLAELDTHPKQCPHRQQKCQMCNNTFPRSLMEQHSMFCQANRPQPSREMPPMYPEFQQRQRQPFPSFVQERRQQQNPLDFMNMMLEEFGAMNRRNRGNRGASGPFIVQFGNGGSFMQLIHMLAGRMGPEQRGMSKQDIRRFPVHKYKPKQDKKQQDNTEMCIICYCNFEEGQDCMTLPCSHIFHPECIGTWLEKNASCPVCKHNFGEGHEEEEEEEREMRARQREREREIPWMDPFDRYYPNRRGANNRQNQ